MDDDGDVIRAVFAAFNALDVDCALRLMTVDVEYWPKVIMMLAGREQPYRGHDGMRACFDDIETLFERVVIDVDSVRSVTGGAMAFGTASGTPVGREAFAVPVMLIVRLRENRVAYARSAASIDELEAGGR